MDRDNGREATMFEKQLTPSDVGKLNRLVIPKLHALNYFPRLKECKRVTTLNFEDESAGKSWRFRYSFWISSQSYVLTKGWSRFVKEKQLGAGDFVVFRKHRLDCDHFFIGWRRRSAPAAPPLHVGSTEVPAAFASYSPVGNAGPCEQNRKLPGGGNTDKKLRLFGVNVECQPVKSRPPLPASLIHPPPPHYYHQ